MAPLIGISTGFTDYGDYLGVAFSRPIEDRGAVPVVIPYTREASNLLRRLDGLVLAVGRDLEPRHAGIRAHPAATAHSPLRDAAEIRLLRSALGAEVPILGICRGMQVINVGLGGTLHADHSVLEGQAADHPGGDWARWEQVVSARLRGEPPPPHPEHSIAIASGSVLATVLGREATVNSYHHQSLARLGRGVEVAARAPDGVIEAIEVPSAPALCLGVQWELQEDPESPLFDLIVERALARSTQARSA